MSTAICTKSGHSLAECGSESKTPVMLRVNLVLSKMGSDLVVLGELLLMKVQQLCK